MLFVPKQIEPTFFRYFALVLSLKFLASLGNDALAESANYDVNILGPSVDPPVPAASDYPDDDAIKQNFHRRDGQILLMAIPEEYLPQYQKFCQASDVVCVQDAYPKDFLFPSPARSTTWAVDFYIRYNAEFMDQASGTVFIATEDAESPGRCEYFTSSMMLHLQRNTKVEAIYKVDVNNWAHQVLLFGPSADARPPGADEQIGLNQGNVDSESGASAPLNLIGMGLPAPESDKISVPDLGFQIGETFKTDEQTDFTGSFQRRRRAVLQPNPNDCFTWLNPSILADLGHLGKVPVNIADLTSTSVGATFKLGENLRLGTTGSLFPLDSAVGTGSTGNSRPLGPAVGTGSTGSPIAQSNNDGRIHLSASKNFEIPGSTAGTGSTGNSIPPGPAAGTGSTGNSIPPGPAAGTGSTGNSIPPGPAAGTGSTGNSIPPGPAAGTGSTGNSVPLSPAVGTGSTGNSVPSGSVEGTGSSGEPSAYSYNQETITLDVIQHDITDTFPNFSLEITITNQQNHFLEYQPSIVAAPKQRISTSFVLGERSSSILLTLGTDDDATLAIRYASPLLPAGSDLTKTFLSSDNKKCKVTPWANSQRDIQCSLTAVY